MIKIIEVLYKFSYKEMLWYDWCISAIYLILIYFINKYILSSLLNGLDYGTYIDIYAGTFVFNIISIFTYKIYYIFYLGPAYLAYIGIKKLWSFIDKAPVTKEDLEEQEKMKSKKEKKRDKEKDKEKIKYKTIK